MLVAALLLLVFMISAVSAADATGEDSSAVEEDTTSSVEEISVSNEESVSNENSENEVLSTDNTDSLSESETLKNTSLTTNSSSVIRGYDISATLTDSDNVSLSNKVVTYTLSGKTYNKTTDSNGKITIPINLAAGTYTLKLAFAGDDNYSGTTKSISLKVLANTPKITTGSTSVMRGYYFYAYLKDAAGKALKGQKITFKVNGKTYTKTTNSNGRAALKIKLPVGKYKVKIVHSASGIYSYAKKTVTIKSLANTPKISLSSKSVIRGKYIYAYLKDGAGKVLSGKKLTFTLNGRTYVKKTNSNGRAALKVKIAAGKYRLRIYHYKSGVYDYKKKSATLTVQKNTPKISVANVTVIKDKYLYVYLKDKAGSVMKSHNVKIRINGKTYTKTTNSNGRAALKLSMAAKSYSTKISFDAVSVYSSKSVTKTINVINDPYKNSILNIEKAATNVRNYVDDYGKLPETVTVGSEKVTIEEFSYLMGEAIAALNKGSTGKVSVLSGIGNVNSTNTSLNTKVFKAEYLDLANRVVSHINTNKVPAAEIEVYNSSKAKVGNANFDLYTYCFAKILNFYRTDGYLPNWCTFESDVFDDASIIPTDDTSPGKVTTADANDFKKGLNEKNTVSDLSQYLKAGGHCALNQAIKNKAASLTKGLTTTAAKANAIFNYVRDGIEYSYYADSKKDASGTLSSGSANCCDQANLVVALCRAAGIPARYSHAQGCTFSSGLVTGHVWAQILVGDTWYAADATSSRNKLGDINNWNTNSYNTLKQYALIPF